MNRKKYKEPSLRIIDLLAEQMIATSTDANGTIDQMPWGSNKKEEDASLWNESENSIWK